MSSVRTGRYSHPARVLHWVSAVVILWATVTGIYMSVGAGPELRELISFINISVTTLLIPLFVLRIGHRLVSRKPGPLDVPRRERHAARIDHFMLYALTTVVLTSGVLMMEKDINVFNWISIPQPVDDEALTGSFSAVHRASSGPLGLMILIHVAAVIRHERRSIRVLRRDALEPSATPQLDSGGRGARSRCERLSHILLRARGCRSRHGPPDGR